MVIYEIRVEDAEWDTTLRDFLSYQAVPLDPETNEPTMTDEEWFGEWVGRMLDNAYAQGAKRERDRLHRVDAPAGRFLVVRRLDP